ncbi:MAG: hypothetical protein DCC68_21395 [Planctomycetota bacterium]|nr:MAG: hypothetical protein DCC68_21395 [Planctomycetota bacterium]
MGAAVVGAAVMGEEAGESASGSVARGAVAEFAVVSSAGAESALPTNRTSAAKAHRDSELLSLILSSRNCGTLIRVRAMRQMAWLRRLPVAAARRSHPNDVRGQEFVAGFAARR